MYTGVAGLVTLRGVLVISKSESALLQFIQVVRNGCRNRFEVTHEMTYVDDDRIQIHTNFLHFNKPLKASQLMNYCSEHQLQNEVLLLVPDDRHKKTSKNQLLMWQQQLSYHDLEEIVKNEYVEVIRNQYNQNELYRQAHDQFRSELETTDKPLRPSHLYRRNPTHVKKNPRRHFEKQQQQQSSEEIENLEYNHSPPPRFQKQPTQVHSSEQGQLGLQLQLQFLTKQGQFLTKGCQKESFNCENVQNVYEHLNLNRSEQQCFNQLRRINQVHQSNEALFEFIEAQNEKEQPIYTAILEKLSLLAKKPEKNQEEVEKNQGVGVGVGIGIVAAKQEGSASEFLEKTQLFSFIQDKPFIQNDQDVSSNNQGAAQEAIQNSQETVQNSQGIKGWNNDTLIHQLTKQESFQQPLTDNAPKEEESFQNVQELNNKEDLHNKELTGQKELNPSQQTKKEDQQKSQQEKEQAEQKKEQTAKQREAYTGHIVRIRSCSPHSQQMKQASNYKRKTEDALDSMNE